MSQQRAQAIVVNGEPRTVPLGSTVASLLDLLELGGKRVAVAVNSDIVPRSSHRTAALHAGDEVEILEAVGGG